MISLKSTQLFLQSIFGSSLYHLWLVEYPDWGSIIITNGVFSQQISSDNLKINEAEGYNIKAWMIRSNAFILRVAAHHCPHF